MPIIHPAASNPVNPGAKTDQAKYWNRTQSGAHQVFKKKPYYLPVMKNYQNWLRPALRTSRHQRAKTVRAAVPDATARRH